MYTPVKRLFEAQHDRIPIDPAILAAIGHRFIAKKLIIKNADARVLGDERRYQKQETFFFLALAIGLMFSLH